jgi:hypothetical protein
MNKGKMAFAQVMEFASHDVFKRCVGRYNGHYRVKSFSCWKQFLCLAFGQLTHRESMSDTMLCLSLNSDKLYHLGIGKLVDKSTVSRANESRDWRIYQDFGLKLIEQAKIIYKGDNQLKVNLKGDVFILDSTTVDLCLEVFWWAPFRKTKAAIKIHTLLDAKTSIPEFVFITDGKVHDVNILDDLYIQRGSYYLMDKAYIDFSRLFYLNLEKAYFIVRAKENIQFKKLSSRNTELASGILSDHDICLTGPLSKDKYPGKLRRIEFYDSEYDRHLVFITNNFAVKAKTVAQLYKHRWYVEIFFKWIKQNLRIKSFWGQSENAVRIQVWVAISVYVMVAIAKKKLNITNTLYEILQYISICPFEKTPLFDVFSDNKLQEIKELYSNQLKFNYY